MQGRRLLILGVLVLGAGLTWWFATGDTPGAASPTAADDGDSDTGSAEVAPEGAMLRGGGDGSDDGDAKPSELDKLLARSGTGSQDENHAAYKSIKALYEEGKVPLERLVDVVLGHVGQGNSELRTWALKELVRNKPESNRFLNRILEEVLGADDKRQDFLADVIRQWGEVTAAQVPVIQKIFAHEKSEYWIKRVLIDAMDELGADALPLVTHLCDYIRDVLKDRAKAQKEAVEAGISVSWDHVEFDVERLLASMGDDVVPILVERLKRVWAEPKRKDDEDTWAMWEPEGVWADAIASSGEHGLETMLKLLETVDPEHRSTIIHALRWVDGPNETLRLAFVRLLKDSDAWIRRQAADALGKHGKASIPALLEALADTDAGVRKEATQSLGTLKVPPEQAMTALMKLLEGDDASAALTAGRAIAGFDRAALPALPRLIELLSRMDGWERGEFAGLVGQVGSFDPVQLLRAYEAGPESVRDGLVDAVDSMGKPLPAEINQMLEQALASTGELRRTRAAARLMAEGHKDALAPLIAGFDSKDARVRTFATLGLAHAGAAAAHLVPRMIERLGKEDLYIGSVGGLGGEIRESGALDQAIAALGRFDFDSLYELIDNEEFDVYYASRGAFSNAREEGLAFLSTRWANASHERKKAMLDIARSGMYDRGQEGGTYREAAAAFIRTALADPSAQIRIDAVNSMYRAKEYDTEILPVLIKLLDNASAEIRHSAGYRIQSLGTRTAPVEDDLRGLLNHKDPDVRRYVQTALDKIEDARKGSK